MIFLNVKDAIGIEAIDFQSSVVADQITKMFEDILKCKGGKEADASEAHKTLVTFMEKETGLKIDLKFNTPYPPCMMPIHVNPSSILGDSDFKDYYTKDANKIIKKLEDNEKTFVDLKNGKVGGAFSVVPSQIYMGFRQLKDMKLTAREVAAVFMHEVGHAFVAYELAFNTIQTNQILLALHKSLVANDQKLFEYSLKLTEKRLGPSSGVYNELKEETDTTVVTTVVMAKIQEKRVSELGTAAYDKTTYEAMADNFATRMGLGRELVTSLEKSHRLYGSPEYSGETRFIYNMIQITVATYSMLLGAVLGSVLLMIAGAPMFFLITWAVSDGAEYQNVYDKLKIRYKRVREQLISRLKVKSLAPELVKNILEDLKVLDKIIEQTGEFSSILNVVGNIIYPSNWVLSSRKNAQRLLEELASNDLFIKAAQLRGN